MKSNQYSRRNFISTVALTGAALPFVAAAGFKAGENKSLVSSTKLHAFSKALHSFSYDDMSSILADAGIEGIDLTVRPGGHVLPDRVETDLPKAVEAARKKGLVIEMIVTGINNPDDPFTERILKTASSQGVKFYRMGYLEYDQKECVYNSLQKTKPILKKLEALNRKYNIHGAYQNHHGTRIGGPVWDIYELLKDFDPTYIGCQYDVRHAVAEGGSSWVLGLKLLAPWIKCTDIKDFHWSKTDGKWWPETVPMGEGMVNFEEYFKIVKQFNISGPASLHLEYPPFERSKQEFTKEEKKKLFTEAIRKDVGFVKAMMTKYSI